MRIRCFQLSLPEHLEHLKPNRAAGNWAWPVALNREYFVLSMEQGAGGMWFATFEHHEREMPVSAPLALFEVVEAEVSASWNIRVNGDSIALQPEEFDDKLFCDDVQERRGDALDRYRTMKARLGVKS